MKTQSLVAVALLHHLFVITLLSRLLGFLNLAILALEALGGALLVHDRLEQRTLLVLLRHSISEVLGSALDHSADVGVFRDATGVILLAAMFVSGC